MDKGELKTHSQGEGVPPTALCLWAKLTFTATFDDVRVSGSKPVKECDEGV